ncbi:MmyB family transcriptional regulator [Nocardia niigatensis]|uniref:MmyB family transcriptional regulator n=1 Tax=Nocardia niigatensis TaxID=209249 RepID=UPI0012F65E9B|nr:helix-turn-helix domain-containing protein [Nocardia niigatensis]
MNEPTKPSLGQQLTFLRKREEDHRHETGALPAARKLSREKAAAEAHITASYLTKVERDEVGQVDVGILRVLATTYHASDDEWRYICDLAGYASPYPSIAGIGPELEIPPFEVFETAVTPIMDTEMAEAATDLVSFYAPQRRLITANPAYYDTFPTHRPGMYMLEWSFTDEAREIMINWSEQAGIGVATHRGFMGRYGHTVWAREYHERLERFPDFRRMWEAGAVTYTLPLDMQSRLRVRGGRYTLTMENWQMQHQLPIVRSRGRLHPLDT